MGMERGAAVRTWGEGNGHHEQSPASVLGASTSALGVKGGVQWDDGRDFSNAEQAVRGCCEGCVWDNGWAVIVDMYTP